MKLNNQQLAIMTGKICPYCLKETEYLDSAKIYGISYGFVYACLSCDAYVGCHRGTKLAKGRLAKPGLRIWKKEAHKYFDQIWKNGIMKRSYAYKWLSNKLGIPPEYTHIGMFGIETCKKVFSLSKECLKSNGYE